MRSGGLAAGIAWSVPLGVLVGRLVVMGRSCRDGYFVGDGLQASAGRCCADGSANAADAPNQSRHHGLKFLPKNA